MIGVPLMTKIQVCQTYVCVVSVTDGDTGALIVPVPNHGGHRLGPISLVALNQMEIGIVAKVRHGAMLRFREEQGITQAKAAMLAGVSTSLWCALECMRFNGAYPLAMARVADLLCLQVDDVFPPELRKGSFGVQRTAYRQVDNNLLATNEYKKRMLLPDPCDEVQRKIDGEARKERIRAALKTLSYREREIIKLRFGLGVDGQTYTYEEVSKIFKVTRERVRQVEARAIRKLQHPARSLVR